MMNILLLKMESLLQNALSSSIILSTEEYNIILLMLASDIFPYTSNDTTSMMLEIYTHTTGITNDEEGTPDGTTYAILILTLLHKGGAPLDATRIVTDMMENYSTMDAEAWRKASNCLERCKNITLCEELVRIMTTRRIKTRSVITSL